MGVTEGGGDPIAVAREQFSLLWRDAQLRRFIATRGLLIATALAPHIGYDNAAKLAKEAYETGRTIRELATEKKLMSPAKLNRALDVRHMTNPGR